MDTTFECRDQSISLFLYFLAHVFHSVKNINNSHNMASS